MGLPNVKSLRLAAWRRSPGARRAFLLVSLSLCVTFLLVDFIHFRTPVYHEGDVASRDLRAPETFTYSDRAEMEARRQGAERAVPLVFDYDATLASRMQNRITLAFDGARRKLLEARILARGPGRIPPEVEGAVEAEFLSALEFSVDEDYLGVIVGRGFDETLEGLAKEFVGVALRKYIIGDRSLLPASPRGITIRRMMTESETEFLLDDETEIETPDTIRQDVALYALERGRGAVSPEEARAAAAIARAAIRPNLNFDEAETNKRRQAARDAVPAELREVRKGTTIFRAGDILDASDIDMLEALRSRESRSNVAFQVLPLLALAGLVFTIVFQFAATNIRRVSRDMRNLEAAGFILVVVLGIVRLAIAGGEILFSETGGFVRPVGLGFMVPVAAGAMLARILANGETALLFSVVAALFGGLMMEEHASFALFYLVSSIAAVAGMGLARERLQVLRAGLQCALVNGTLVILLAMVHSGSTETLSAGRLLWEALFAVCGGFFSAFMVLGLVPFFELFGFVTNYKLVELANLNHPLLRNLMLRAPGTYHHSVVVGSLAEAAAEAVGANALLARVSSYFHDIGKTERPDFFVENIRAQPNPHDNLEPLKSVEILHRHVKDGAREARKYGLPQPIVDIIWMHHGTSMAGYFYDKACRLAPPDAPPDITLFRYPGPRPNTREAGIVHLADKVEAACRSLDPPTRDRIRETIQRILNQVVADGQLEICPLTLKEIYAITNSFEDVLMGIYHHRIAYPDTALHPPQAAHHPPSHGERTEAQAARAGMITLEIPNPLREGSNGKPPNGQKTEPPVLDLDRKGEPEPEVPLEEERSGTITVDLP